MPIYRIDFRRTKVSDADAPSAANPAEAYRYLKEHCYKDGELWRESAWALYLTKDNHVLGHQRISTGGTSSTTIDVKILAKGALDSLAESVILSHNHVSGNTTPGQLDIRQTANVRTALASLGISLADHIIYAEKEYFSFQKERKTQVQ